ncbi:MAG TPA: ATP-binding protein [Planctomycetota bacterium]|nr:ATP-binding protein [Planctomycetota bacterium]
MRSIQRNLVLWLVVALAAGMALVIAVTYGYAYWQITRIFDDELVKVAEAVHLGEDWRGPGRVRIPRQGFNLSVRAYDERGATYFETAEPSMPEDLPKAIDSGFAVVRADGGPWRVYTHVSREGIVQVGQPEATRSSLARHLSLRMALPELVLIPPFVLFMAWVLRRGLAPLTHISRRVEDRHASRLDPLPTEDVPAELQPLIRQINGLLARLAASMAAQRRFVADAAHELRTPVAALALQAQVAERAGQPAARSVAFAELHKGIGRAARLVEQLLRLARLGPEASAEEHQPVDLAEIAREVVGSMAYNARTLGIDLGAEASAPAPMPGAKSELRSLISNLVDNALRYAPHGSEVTVKVARDASGTRMTVLDAGPGIPAAEREAVFERFQRASDDDTPGVGLGLAIAKAVVERHGGRIWLEDANPCGVPPGLAACVVFPG